jgi:hypothetical protein
MGNLAEGLGSDLAVGARRSKGYPGESLAAMKERMIPREKKNQKN